MLPFVFLTPAHHTLVCSCACACAAGAYVPLSAQTNCKNGVQHSVYDTNIHYCATPAVSSWSQCESNCRELGTWSAWGLVNWGMVTPCTATMNNLLLNLANGWFSVAAQAAAGKNMALDLGASDTWEEGE